MTTVYAVIYTIGGYAREDADVAKLGGVYTDPARAEIHRRVVSGTVASVELDHMPKGVEEAAMELGLIPKKPLP